MNVYLDFEFRSAPGVLEPISIGMAAEDGRTLYRVFSEFDWGRLGIDPWLVDNVKPKLDAVGNTATHTEIRDEVAEFLKPYVPDDKTVLCGWYCAFDFVLLTKLWGDFADMPPWVPQWIFDVRQEQYRLNNRPVPRQSYQKHNALADARQCQYIHSYLKATELEGGILT